jgi:hypothetical protein
MRISKTAYIFFWAQKKARFPRKRAVKAKFERSA